MPEKLTLTKPIRHRVMDGISVDVPDAVPVDIQLHMEPTFDPTTGEFTGYKADGSFIRLFAVGKHGLRIFDGQTKVGEAALQRIAALNNAVGAATGKKMRVHILEDLAAVQVQTGADPETGDPIIETPYAGVIGDTGA